MRLKNHGYELATVASNQAYKILRVHFHVTLSQHLTAKEGGNADFAGAYIFLADKTLKTKIPLGAISNAIKPETTTEGN